MQKENNAPVVKARMTNDQLEWMFAHIYRLPDVFSMARQHLKPELFNPATEPHLRLLWEVTLELIAEHTAAFFFDTPKHIEMKLDVTMKAKLKQERGGFDQTFYDRLFGGNGEEGLLTWLYADKRLPELNIATGLNYLRDFRIEREVNDELRKTIEHAGEGTLVNLPIFLQELKEKQIAIQASEKDPVQSALPEEHPPTPITKKPTGIPFIDPALRGGHAGGECYGCLGAFGSGKTCLATQILAGGIKHEVAMYGKDTSYIPGEWYIFTYEATPDELRVRLWSQLCTIDHARIEDIPYEQWSTSKNGFDSLAPYEKKYWATQHKLTGDVPGEQERLYEQRPVLARARIFDMTGNSDNPKQGTGYVEEIAALIDADLRRRTQADGKKHWAAGVVIDYAGLAAKRAMVARGESEDKLRHRIGDFGDRCKRLIAVPYNCPVWIFHQLSSEANSRKVVAKSHYSEAAEARNFAENLVYCFAMGVRDQKYGAMYFNCSKARRSAIPKPPLITLEGAFFRLRLAENLIANKNGEIVPKDEFDVADLDIAETAAEEVETSESIDKGMVDDTGPELLATDYDGAF